MFETASPKGCPTSGIDGTLVVFSERMVELDHYVPGNAAGTYTSYQTLLASKFSKQDPEDRETVRKELRDYDEDDEDWI